MYYCFTWNVKNIALEIHTVADRDTWKVLFLICDFLRYFFKNGRPIPSIGDTHASTPMLLELSLENQWSTVILPVEKFRSRHLSRVHRTLSVVCEVTKTASASAVIVGISCSDVFFFKDEESIMIMYGCVFCNTGICRTRYFKTCAA